LTDIAIQTGFANQSALSHAFRSSYGASPRQLRQGTASATLPTTNGTPSTASAAAPSR
jgi:transcriptional regulator GlxA family with amidase domain